LAPRASSPDRLADGRALIVAQNPATAARVVERTKGAR
jgi:hypothetical protein